MKSATEREIQNNAQMIYGWLKAMATPRDATATLMMAQAALVWSQRPADEAKVRELMASYTDGVVALWRAQMEAANDARRTAGDDQSHEVPN